MRKRSVLCVSLTIAAVCLFVACGGSPGGPSEVLSSRITSIQVIGPDSLARGQSVQFVARVSRADGTTRPETGLPNLRWRSSDTSVISVTDRGIVTANPSRSGEAVITAEITASEVLPSSIQDTRKVVIRPTAVVTGTLEVSLQGTPGQRSYVFTVTLTESAGFAASVTDLWINLDSGWSGQCNWTPNNLGQTRLPANGTLALGPLTCGLEKAFDVEVSISFIDDKGDKVNVGLYREL